MLCAMAQISIKHLGDSVTEKKFFLGNFFKDFQASSTGVFVTKCIDFKKQCWPMV